MYNILRIKPIIVKIIFYLVVTSDWLEQVVGRVTCIRGKNSHIWNFAHFARQM